MARYDYKCPACGNVFEVEHPMSERPTITCPDCGEVAQRVFEASGIVFKGSGFYNTDQRGKASKATSATSAASKSETKGSSESKDTSTSAGSSTSSAKGESKSSSTTSAKTE